MATQLTGPEWLEGRDAAWHEARRRTARSGPVYHGNTSQSFVPWYDQFFDREISPAGTVNCAQALRVGSTQKALMVTLVASHANTGKLTLAAGATITLNLLQGDAEDGAFEDVAPTTCITVPAGGKEVWPDQEIYTFPLNDFRKPWLMVSLDFDGAIAGGTLDVALTYAAR